MYEFFFNMELSRYVVLTLPIVNYFKVQELVNGVSCKGFGLICFNSFVQNSLIQHKNTNRAWSSYVLKFPNDTYTTLSQNLIGCSTLSQE